MKKLATALLMSLVLLAGSAHHARAQTLLFDYVGFDFEDPNPQPATFGEFGSGYVSVGFVPGLFAPLVADTTTNEYTYVINGMTPSNITPIGTYIIIDYTPGLLSVYEDSKTSGTPADYSTNPPNAIAPPTFTDGNLFVQGTLTGFQIVINTADGSGSYEGKFNVTSGSQLSNFPVNQRAGWTFAGLTGNALNIPQGYSHQVDGQTFLDKPVAAHQVTWGQIKTRWR